jgi:hypothetical protein
MEDREEFITEGVISETNLDKYFLQSFNRIKNKLTDIQILLVNSLLKFIEPTKYSPNKGFELRRIRYEGDESVLIDYKEGDNPYLAGAVEAYEHVINIVKDR